MSFIVLHEYYYRYREQRKQIKNLVDAANYADARTRLENVIAENNNYVQSRNIPNDGNNFSSNDNLSLRHAKKHLDSTIENQQEQRPIETIEQQKQATIDALNEPY